MKKNVLLAVLMSIASSSVMTSCGGTDNPSSSPTKVVDFKVPTGGFDTTKDVSITFYSTMGDTLQKVFEAYLEEFNAIYPNIHVETQFIGGYNDVRDQMSTELASGKSDVNIAYCYPDHVATYNTSKSVITLDNLIEDDEYGFTASQYNDFVGAFYNEGKSFGDGKMYCLPFSKSSEVMYYNKTVFDELGLSVPDHWFKSSANDVTSMEYVCEALKKAYPDSFPLGYDSGANWFITMCQQLNTPYTSATGSHYLFDNDDNKAFVSKFEKWHKQGLVTTKDIAGKYTSALFTSTDLQKCFMCIGSSAGASYQDSSLFDVQIAPIPQENKSTYPAVIQQGPDVCIFTNDDPQKVLASWLVVKYFTTNVEFQAEFSIASGYTPVIKSVYNNAAYASWLNGGSIQAKSTKICVEQEAYYFTSPAFVGSSTARTQVGNLITQVLTKGNIDEAFAEAVAKCKE